MRCRGSGYPVAFAAAFKCAILWAEVHSVRANDVARLFSFEITLEPSLPTRGQIKVT